jgi:hypothetical protein
MNPQPTILSLTQYGKTITISCETSDVNINDMAEMIENMLYAAGWGKETIESVIVKG